MPHHNVAVAPDPNSPLAKFILSATFLCTFIFGIDRVICKLIKDVNKQTEHNKGGKLTSGNSCTMK